MDVVEFANGQLARSKGNVSAFKMEFKFGGYLFIGSVDCQEHISHYVRLHLHLEGYVDGIARVQSYIYFAAFGLD